MDDRDSRRWLIVKRRARDPRLDFCYGVITTRIYCRPTCPGRVARRANVVFFDDALTARTSGYRACKRCNPESDEWDRDARSLNIVHRAQAIIAQSSISGHMWTVDGVATQLCISATHLHRIFKKHVGLTPKEFAQAQSGSWRDAVRGDTCPSPTNQHISLKLSGSSSPADTRNAANQIAPPAMKLNALDPIKQPAAPRTPLITSVPLYPIDLGRSFHWEDCLLFDNDAYVGSGSDAGQHTAPEYDWDPDCWLDFVTAIDSYSAAQESHQATNVLHSD